MLNTKINDIVQLLVVFLNLFDAKIKNYDVNEESIKGSVYWIDDESDEVQDFVFNNNLEGSQIKLVEKLSIFIKQNNLISSDKIKISEENLISLLIKNQWNETDAIEAVDSLCNIEVKMVDDGEETDSFFVHF